MISYGQALLLGLLQGVSELFPISSLGHSVLLPRLLGWQISQEAPYFISFLVATHLATALVLVGFFWEEWKRIVAGLWRSLREREIKAGDVEAKLGWLLVVGTVPAGILGLLLEEPLHRLFASARSAALFLIVNGVLLYLAERLRRRSLARQGGKAPEQRMAAISWTQAVEVGAAQALALVPGFSRSGLTMAGGLLFGLSTEDAAHFSFLLATPIIGLAALLKLPELLGPAGDGVRGPALLGAIAAGLAAYFSVRFLLRYFRSNRLTPFAIYCLLAGLVFTLCFWS